MASVCTSESLVTTPPVQRCDAPPVSSVIGLPNTAQGNGSLDAVMTEYCRWAVGESCTRSSPCAHSACVVGPPKHLYVGFAGRCMVTAAYREHAFTEWPRLVRRLCVIPVPPPYRKPHAIYKLPGKSGSGNRDLAHDRAGPGRCLRTPAVAVPWGRQRKRSLGGGALPYQANPPLPPQRLTREGAGHLFWTAGIRVPACPSRRWSDVHALAAVLKVPVRCRVHSPWNGGRIIGLSGSCAHRRAPGVNQRHSMWCVLTNTVGRRICPARVSRAAPAWPC